MHNERGSRPVGRRTFLSWTSAGAGALAAIFGLASPVEAQAPASTPFQPARHPEDDWLDNTQAKHRLLLDTTSAAGLRDALDFADNFFNANAKAYKLTDADLAEVICLRHYSTSFAFDDTMWGKYGAGLAEGADDFVDPKTKQVPTANPYESDSVTLSSLAKRGARFAVCGMATQRIARIIARRSASRSDAVEAELIAHLLPGGHMVSAGIVAVNRAQERGYTGVSVN